MGGSVLYNPVQHTSGHLAKGTVVAVRLGKVDRENVNTEQSNFIDRKEDARYGYITVNSIDKNQIGFIYTEYAVNGSSSNTSAYNIRLNGQIDINYDGNPDITYVTPFHKRPGMEEATYLTFLSSQETLTTAMFAVLPEQYSQGVYPSGLIGINPDGKFIVSKYKNNSTSRSVLAGIQKGDIIVDNLTGKYQRVSTSFNRGARAISDTELKEIEQTNIPVSYRFTDEEFTDGYNAQNLFSALPASIQSVYQESVSWIEKLNLVLENRDLLMVVYRETENNFSEYEASSAMSQIAELSVEELIQFNRKFLQEIYPEFIDPNESFVQLIPLASLIVGDFDGVAYSDRMETASRATSASEYAVQWNKIEAQFLSYKRISSFPLSLTNLTKLLKIDTKGLDIAFSNSFVKTGVKAIFSNSWGNVSASIEGVVYINADTNIELTSSFNKSIKDISLWSLDKRIDIPVFSCGPIVLNIGGAIGTSIPFSINITTPIDCKGRLAFTGLYGAGVGASVKYGIKSKKILFVHIPYPYVDGSTSGWKIENNAYYIGVSPNYSAGFKDASISVSPNVHGSIGVNISKVVDGGLYAETGIEDRVDISYENRNLKGLGMATAYAKLSAEVKIGVDVPLIGFVGYKNSIPLVNTVRKKLYEAVIFQKKI
ncbi:hypothetical protein Holit_00174 [Hollandina sp. SP2]